MYFTEEKKRKLNGLFCSELQLCGMEKQIRRCSFIIIHIHLSYLERYRCIRNVFADSEFDLIKIFKNSMYCELVEYSYALHFDINMQVHSFNLEIFSLNVIQSQR